MKLLVLVVYFCIGLHYGDGSPVLTREPQITVVKNVEEASIILFKERKKEIVANLYEVSTSTVKEISIPTLEFK